MAIQTISMFPKFSWLVVSLIVIAAMGTTGQAGEASYMRGLQDGPWGEGLSFARMHSSEVEAGYNGSRQTGLATTSHNELLGIANIHELGFAAGYRTNSNLRFTTFWQSTMVDRSYETDDRQFDYSSQAAFHEIGAGPIVAVDNLVFGGNVSAVIMEEETRTVRYKGEQANSEIAETVIPRMRIFAGIYSKTVRFVLGIKAFNRSKVTQVVEDNDNNTTYLDAKRSLPGEVWLDARIRATQNVILAFGITGEGLAQQNRKIDEETIGLELAGLESSNETKIRNRNRVSMGFGGIYRASPDFRLSSSLKIRQASYRDSQYASAIANNLGGTEINVGSVSDLENILLKFNAGYFIPTGVHYEVSEQRATPWAEKGDRVAVENPTWKLGLSASIRL